LSSAIDGDREDAVVNPDDFPNVPLFHRPGPIGCEAVRRLACGEFVHLNRCENIGREAPDWQLGPRSKQRLWTITLHYHSWVYELADVIRRGGEAAREAEQLLLHYLSDWIERCDLNVAGAREMAWNPFAIATRIGWWIRADIAWGQSWMNAHPQFRSKFLQSLYRQAEYLNGHLEWDLLANHILRDAVGLAWAARFFRGERPRRWMAKATAIAAKQLHEQVLPDGGHFERSPMYHVHVMEDVLSLAQLVEDQAVKNELSDTWVRMAEYLAWMRHPDGEIPLFNDSALGAVSHPAAMLAHRACFGISAGANQQTDKPDQCEDNTTPCEVTAIRAGGRYFAETGMVVWHGQGWTVFFDVGEVGPDCQPGHAHADTLSVECSVNGQRLFVDPGTYAYDHDEHRRYDRSTSSHNTVCVDGVDSSEVWHIFRVGARAKPRDVRVELSADSMAATGSHDGYDRLPGAPRHTRCLSVRNGGPLEISDRVDGKQRHRIEGGFLLAPGWQAAPCPSGWNVSNGDQQVRITVSSVANVQLLREPRVTHPQFGLELETTRLSWRWDGVPPVEVLTTVEADSCTSCS
jgi:uncharacterized heparinase superfamily protein